MYAVLQTPEKDEETMRPCNDINILSRVQLLIQLIRVLLFCIYSEYQAKQKKQQRDKTPHATFCNEVYDLNR